VRRIELSGGIRFVGSHGGEVLSFLHKYAKNYVFSQNGEEGCILEILKRLGIQKGSACEIGGANGLFCSNTALLLKDHGWSGLFVEADYGLYLECKENWKDNPRVRSQCSRVDGNNINAFVDERCDVLSIDTDGPDYKIFAGLKAKPKIVIIEIDSSIEPPSTELNSDGACGSWPMVELARNKGYFVLAHTGNLILVDDRYWASHFPEITAHPLLNWEQYFNRSWMKENAA
jgi:hypothetical protein